MKETVGINGLSLCHKHSDGWVRSTLPDVCKAPKKPVPFTNVAFAKDLTKGTTTVFSHKGAMNGVKGAEFSVSIGDEPGVGGGVKSGVNLHRATFLSWSPDVFMEGRPVTRLTDRMLLNKGNTVSAGGYFTGPIKSVFNKDLLDKICGYICDCMAAGTATQACVAAKVAADPANAANGIIAEQAYQRATDTSVFAHPDAWGIYLGPGAPQGRGIPGLARPDISDLGWSGGVTPKAIVEVKFPTDRYRGNQYQTYQSIAQWYNIQLETIETQDCACDDKDRKKKPAPATEPGTSTDPRQAPDQPPIILPLPGREPSRRPKPGRLPGLLGRILQFL